jgi:hypothetical protein
MTIPAALIGGGLGLLGSALSSNAATSAAETSANAQLEAAKAGRFGVVAEYTA